MPPEGPTPRRHIALVGGSFDPPHHAHVLVITWALCLQRFDAIHVVPVYGHAFEKRLSPFGVRCEMVRAATDHLGPAVVVDTIESRLPTPSYTIDTVEALQAAEAGLAVTLIMGTDAWAQRRRWHRWDALERRAEVLVVGREGALTDDLDPPIRLPALSSTAVRAAVAAGQPIDAVVCPAVRALVARHGLYRQAPVDG